jgi:hypothetical protein
MSGVFSQFQFRSTKLVRNPTPRAVMATSGAKKVAVDFFEANAPNAPPSNQNSCLVCFRSFGFGQQNTCETRPQGPFWPLVERKKLQLIFRIERTQSTLFDPKLVSAVFWQFRFRSTKLVRKPAPRAILATSGAKKVAVDFFKANAPNAPPLTQNSCLVRFRSFGFVQQNSCETRPLGPFWPLVERKKLHLIFSKRTHPIHPH